MKRKTSKFLLVLLALVMLLMLPCGCRRGLEDPDTLNENLNPQGLGTAFDVPAPYDAAQSCALLRVHLRHGQHSSLG